MTLMPHPAPVPQMPAQRSAPPMRLSAPQPPVTAQVWAKPPSSMPVRPTPPQAWVKPAPRAAVRPTAARYSGGVGRNAVQRAGLSRSARRCGVKLVSGAAVCSSAARYGAGVGRNADWRARLSHTARRRGSDGRSGRLSASRLPVAALVWDETASRVAACRTVAAVGRSCGQFASPAVHVGCGGEAHVTSFVGSRAGLTGPVSPTTADSGSDVVGRFRGGA